MSDTDGGDKTRRSEKPQNCFRTPEKYKKRLIPEDVNVTISNLNTDTDLWLIRAPADLNFGLMQNLEISLKRPSSHSVSDSRTINCNPSKESENLKGLTVLLSDKESDEMMPVNSVFAGQLVLSEEINVPEIQFPRITESKLELPTGIKERFVPFGSVLEEMSPKERRKLKKQKKRELDRGDDGLSNTNAFHERREENVMRTPPSIGLEESTEEQRSTPKKKKKKKSKHDDDEVSIKKHKKKRGSTEEEEEVVTKHKRKKSDGEKSKKRRHKD